MMEPRSTATIKALASLAELSANQLEEGVSVDEVIATLRKAADAVRLAVDSEDSVDLDTEEDDLSQDLTPVNFSEETLQNNSEDAVEDETLKEEPVLHAS